MKNQTTKRLRQIGRIHLEKRTMTQALKDRPVTKVQLDTLKGTNIPMTIYNRGRELYQSGRVHQNRLYPWKYTVSGDDHATGTTLYSVDLAVHECSCMYYLNTQSTCKHLVASLLDYINHEVKVG